MTIEKQAEAYATERCQQIQKGRDLGFPPYIRAAIVVDYLAGYAAAKDEILAGIFEAVQEVIEQVIVDSGADCIQTTKHYLESFAKNAELPAPPEELEK